MTDDEDDYSSALPGILARAAARRQDVDMLPADRAPVSDLCRPLSAKVLPRSALVTTTGRLITAEVAVRKQRGVSTSKT